MLSRFLWLSVLAFASLVHSAPAAEIANYHFDENMGGTSADASGNGYDATLVGGGWTLGVAGSALTLDGVDDVVTTTFPGTAAPAQWTIDAWIRDERASGTREIVSLDFAGLGFSLDVSGRPVFSGCSPATAVVAGFDWVHVAVVWNGTQLAYYIDGVPAGTFVCNPNPTWARLQIGGSNVSNRFGGAIDELRIVDFALSQGQIQARIDTPGGPSEPVPSAGSVGYALLATLILGAGVVRLRRVTTRTG